MMRAALGTAALAAVLAFLAGAAWQASRSPQPRLAGYGCEFTAGPIYAHEESDFPPCARIAPANLETWGGR